jgi:hypothetical protein
VWTERFQSFKRIATAAFRRVRSKAAIPLPATSGHVKRMRGMRAEAEISKRLAGAVPVVGYEFGDLPRTGPTYQTLARGNGGGSVRHARLRLVRSPSGILLRTSHEGLQSGNIQPVYLRTVRPSKLFDQFRLSMLRDLPISCERRPSCSCPRFWLQDFHASAFGTVAHLSARAWCGKNGGSHKACPLPRKLCGRLLGSGPRSSSIRA